jgi:hypothetical protein
LNVVNSTAVPIVCKLAFMLSKGRAFQIRSIEILYRLCAKKRDGPPGFFTQDLKCAVDLTPLSVQSGVRNHTPHFFALLSRREISWSGSSRVKVAHLDRLCRIDRQRDHCEAHGKEAADAMESAYLFLAKITIGCRIKYINRVSNSALSHVKLALCSVH